MVIYYMVYLGGSGAAGFAIDGVVSNSEGNFWTPDTNSPSEWLQIDMLHSETVIEVKRPDIIIPCY